MGKIGGEIRVLFLDLMVDLDVCERDPEELLLVVNLDEVEGRLMELHVG
ncbi:hypothetical protein HanXRQr2_Chr10g0424721 [Helianthus annuus]|uniref:Uncharacterized protein n=1 Tax=Helianthus annuus TaxID=4232 RepID=A0A9K3HV57_HELAN|nr:hypothetical protein HanXRQr2_Chr10g0424721 [Helianthus annuus]